MRPPNPRMAVTLTHSVKLMTHIGVQNPSQNRYDEPFRLTASLKTVPVRVTPREVHPSYGMSRRRQHKDNCPKVMEKRVIFPKLLSIDRKGISESI
jgi:hypothetical protein